MDKLLYVSMGGAKNSMHQLEILTNNLANVNTTGFRADATLTTPHKTNNQGDQSRVYAKLDKVYTDFKVGPTLNTERDLDVAISGKGFIAVQSRTGQEGYTRAGDFNISDGGVLVTHGGQAVIGSAGVISIPDAQRISISSDGTISAKLPGSPEYVQVDKIKLVNPDTMKMTKGPDGLLYVAGGSADVDDSVKLVTGALEGSNVNAIEVMTQIIDLSRSYEIHTNFMKTISDNASKENSLLNMQS